MDLVNTMVKFFDNSSTTNKTTLKVDLSELTKSIEKIKDMELSIPLLMMRQQEYDFINGSPAFSYITVASQPLDVIIEDDILNQGECLLITDADTKEFFRELYRDKMQRLYCNF